ncbi:Small nuclear ribonucleoprotein-associated protein B [Cytospora paraplurivora]|uniref:Mitochondrial pyruvate carrier n=1 Tax=Cytospora paraplurivora TaxID=2898453 RepID=A0AAN9TZL5_9PEZI
MAAFVKAINAKIRSNPYTDYICSTHFWGPVSNFGIPLAAVADTFKSPELISGPMTFALCIYSATFMRYSLAIKPQNYLLFACHLVNEGSQLTQAYRFLDWHKWGGREKAISSGELVLNDAKEVVKEGAQKVEAGAQKVQAAVSK